MSGDSGRNGNGALAPPASSDRVPSPLSPSSPQPPVAGQVKVPDMQLGRCKWVQVLDNIAYIVGAVIVRETDEEDDPEVLLVQEAKKKAYGKWYYPAGHLEPGETVEEATKREVLEETGFHCSVDHLVALEVRGSGWYRFTFACTVTGGEVKTKPDKESLGAGWHRFSAIKAKSIPFRANDFVKVVDEGIQYHRWRKSLPPGVEDKFPAIKNVDQNERGLFTEFVIVKLSNTSDRVEVLVHSSVKSDVELLERDDAFPTAEFSFEYFFPVMVAKCYKHILADGVTAVDPPSVILATTCLPAPLESFQHGLRTRVLCYHKRTFTKSALNNPRRYHWIEILDERVLASLCLVPGQFQPKMFIL